YFLANAAIDFVPVIGDAKALYEAEGPMETTAAVASVVPLVKIVNKGKKVVNAADNANNAKKTTATGAKNTEKSAGNSGKKGSAIPHPEKTPVTTKSGENLYYQSHTKHTPGQPGYSRKAGTEPKNSLELFENSVQSGTKRYTQDTDGNIHQFHNSNGTWHWAGSTGDKTVPLKLENDVKSDLRKQGMKGKILK
ncbi:MAG: hypothetical protein IJ566_04375, partial [Cardiobacteriaceae bacterium]|nr:hypothetical protein [Cardiobacteriaceae bacterium]